MFKYTRAAVSMIIADLKLFYKIFRYISHASMIAYFIFAICMDIGFLPINIAMLSLIVVYSIVDLIVDAKKPRKIIRRSYKWTILALKAVSLSFTIYGLYEAAEKANPVAIILATLMLIFWIIQVTLQIFVDIFEVKMNLFLAALKEDTRPVTDVATKTATTVKNIVHLVKGEPRETVVEPEEESKEIKSLKKYMAKKQKKEK